MNLEQFIAKRIFYGGNNKSKLSNRVVAISQIAIILGVIVMQLSVSIVMGYKKEVADKVFGFGAHIQVVKMSNNKSFETDPIDGTLPIADLLGRIPQVESVSAFATKPGIIKTSDEIQGVVFKGIDDDFDWEFFSSNLKSGDKLRLSTEKVSNDVMISMALSKLLQLSVGDEFKVYFIREEDQLPRVRKLKITSLYETGLEEFDKMFIYGDLRLLRQVSGWDSMQISGFEVRVSDVANVNNVVNDINMSLITLYTDDSELLEVRSVMDIYPQIFDWLELLDMNVYVIIALIILVVGFSMISGLLVIILENTYHVGVLKTLGYPNSKIRVVFRNISLMLIVKGLLWGNTVALAIMFIQKYFDVIKLDSATYYLSSVPIHFDILPIVLINVGIVLVIYLIMYIPSFVANNISPVEAIKFND